MTTWVEPSGGRERGPRGIATAWVQVLVRPRAFFREAVSPGDQAPGLVFAVAVVLVAATTRLLVDPSFAPDVGGNRFLAGLLFLAVLALLVTPLALHAAAALQIVCLLPVTLRRPAEERAGVSQTVQVVAYASAPCALAGLPVPALRLVCAAYGVLLLVVGLATVHDLRIPVAAVLGVPAAVVVFGVWFGGFAAALDVFPWLDEWWAGIGVWAEGVWRAAA
ncbi:YIP1 family protein [Halospeciosus flavus]|uniref:YIP1 family protein n=1 Tax=Halospeciosus flavus TaxID=3032283 RepID=A0ABD5Z9F9_9EURY|nr:YIP1 family protein [Halospeciosus flavus]